MLEKSMHDIPLVEAIRVCMMPALSALSSSKRPQGARAHDESFCSLAGSVPKTWKHKEAPKTVCETYSPEIFQPNRSQKHQRPS